MNPERFPRLAAIQRLLWEEWDPLELNGIAPKDEYDDYAMHVWSMVEKGASVDAVAAYLLDAERKDMELPPLSQSDARAELIARRALAS